MTKPRLKTVMWRLLQSRKVVTYDDLQELAGVSRCYAQEWMATLIKRGIVRKLSKGRYQLIIIQSPEEPYQRNLIPDFTRKQMPKGAWRSKHDVHPETLLWHAMRKKKKFTVLEIVELDIARETVVRQYLAVLVRAGFLTKSLNRKTCNQCCYTVKKITGNKAPIIGKTWFCYDPNTLTVWDDIPEKLKGPEDAATSYSGPR